MFQKLLIVLSFCGWHLVPFWYLCVFGPKVPPIESREWNRILAVSAKKVSLEMYLQAHFFSVRFLFRHPLNKLHYPSTIARYFLNSPSISTTNMSPLSLAEKILVPTGSKLDSSFLKFDSFLFLVLISPI